MARSHARTSRREFLRQAAAASAATALLAPVGVRAAGKAEKVNIACIGVGGKGWSDMQAMAPTANIVAICDVDAGANGRRGGLAAAAEQFPQARRYSDWRKLLDKEHANLEGITVSTPDHMHAPITMTAIQLGLATYTQKPMTRTIYEARQVTLAARDKGVVTQMGNQGHSGVTYRTTVQLIQAGAIGKIREAHAWSDRPKWPQGIERAATHSDVPKTLEWDLWLGVAPERPYVEKAYHTFNWRGWFDFGAGALGDMGCHIIDPVFWSLGLSAPNWVEYEGPTPTKETFPKWEILTYEFPGTQYTAGDTVRVTWYDGGRLPPRDVTGLDESVKLPSNGQLFIGDDGMMLVQHGGGANLPLLLPEKKFADYAMPKLEQVDHYTQWTAAIRGEDKTSASFDYSGPLTETVLLGTVAARFADARLEWDAANLRVKNVHEAAQYIRRPYRKGWEVEGLS